MNKKLYTPLLLTFVNVLGFSVLIPILPFIIQEYGLSQMWFGILLSSYALSLFFGAPILGALSDTFGRKPLLLISQAGTLLCWVIISGSYFIPKSIIIFSFPLAIFVMLVARVLDGITGGNNSVVNAYITDITEPKDRAKSFGLLGATFGIGFMFGPLIGGLTYKLGFGFLGTSLFATLLSTITLYAIWKYLEEPPRHKTSQEDWKAHVLANLNVFSKLYAWRHNQVIASILTLKFVVILCFTGFTSIISLYLIDSFNASATTIGLFLFVIGIYSIVNQMAIVPWMVRTFNARRTVFIGLVILTIGLVIIYFPTNFVIFVISAYIFSLGISVINPTVKAILSNYTEPTKQGEILGLDEALQSLSQGIMPLASSFLYIFFAKAVFFVYALSICFIAIPLAIRALRAEK